MNDQQLDQLVRTSLAWRADRRAARQPSISAAAHRLSARLGPAEAGLRPRVVVAPAATGLAQMLLTLLLLLALLAAAVVVGSSLLEQRRPDSRPGPFGFAALCAPAHSPSVDLHVEVEGGPTTRLHDDGVLAREFSVDSDSKAETVRQALSEERRLTSRGRERLLDRIVDEGLTPGCRALRTGESSGLISALTPDGHVEVIWGPSVGDFRPARVAGSDEVARLVNLARELQQPQEWLPADAWAEPAPRSGPEQWLVTIAQMPTDYRAGDGLNLPNGVFLDGSDPRYEQVALPGGADLATYGEELPFPPSQLVGGSIEVSVRCASLSREEALTLAESLDRLELGAENFDLFTEDLSTEIGIGLRPAIPAGFDCQSLYEEERSDVTPPTAPTPDVEGDLAEIDPCALVPAEHPFLDRLGVQKLVTAPATLGTAPSLSCELFDTTPTMAETGGLHGYWRAILHLYPWSVPRDEARAIALGWLGEGTSEEAINDRVIWTSDCARSASACAGAVAAWSERHLVVIEYAPRRPPAGRRVEATSVRAFVETVLGNIEAR